MYTIFCVYRKYLNPTIQTDCKWLQSGWGKGEEDNEEKRKTEPRFKLIKLQFLLCECNSPNICST